jgi:spoIIIJ-associated protein
MHDVAQAARTIGQFLQSVLSSTGLRVKFRVALRSGRTAQPNGNASGDALTGGGESNGPRTLHVEFSGPDTGMLIAQNGELLNALEHLATKILRLDPESQDQVTFDADRFRANRDRRLKDSALAAIQHVRATGEPYAFPAMNARERRMLHLTLSESGLPTASSGEGAGRYVVLYPAGADASGYSATSQPSRTRDTSQIRHAFRHR